MYLPTRCIIKRLGIASVEIDKTYSLTLPPGGKICVTDCQATSSNQGVFPNDRSILVPMTLFVTVSRRGLSTRNEGHFVPVRPRPRRLRETNRAMGTRMRQREAVESGWERGFYFVASPSSSSFVLTCIAPPDNDLLQEILCLSSSFDLGSIAKYFWISLLIRR